MDRMSGSVWAGWGKEGLPFCSQKRRLFAVISFFIGGPGAMAVGGAAGWSCG